MQAAVLRARFLRLSAAAGTAALGGALLLPAAADSVAQNQITIPVHHVFQGKPVEFHKPSLRLKDGTAIELIRLEYLISNVRLQHEDGSWLELKDQFFHINASEGQETITLANIADEPLRAISLTIGLDEKTNHADSAQWPAGHALNPLVNNLHWDWKGGYVFLAVEGRMASADHPRSTFLYHIGGDANRMEIHCEFEKPTCLRDMDFAFNVDQLWDAPDAVSPWANTGLTHSREGDDLAPKLAANAKHAFVITPHKDGEK